MPLTIDGELFYRIGEALRMAKISRPTYFRWIKDGRISDARHRDRNRRRIFTPEEVRMLIAETDRIVSVTDSGGDPEQLDLPEGL